MHTMLSLKLSKDHCTNSPSTTTGKCRIQHPYPSLFVSTYGKWSEDGKKSLFLEKKSL